MPALLTCKSIQSAADKIGVAEKTLRNWLAVPAFVTAYRAARRAIVETAIAKLQERHGEGGPDLGQEPDPARRPRTRSGPLASSWTTVCERSRSATWRTSWKRSSGKWRNWNMSVATMQRDAVKLMMRLDQHQATATATPMLNRLQADPARCCRGGHESPPTQTRLLRCQSARMLLLCSRQAGKSTTAAALALLTTILQAPALVLLLSPTLRQSGELFRKVLDLYRLLGRPIATAQPRKIRSRSSWPTVRGSSACPAREEGIRGYSGVSLLVIDEASRVSDDLYPAVRPMLAVSRGRLVALSTPSARENMVF